LIVIFGNLYWINYLRFLFTLKAPLTLFLAVQ
jgi:hypothetical protein